MNGRDWLNYHHLQYFWITAHEGSLTRASQRLRLAPSTVSAQLRQLETAVGRPLFQRRGRGMLLTDTGRMVLEYADEIFSVGQALCAALEDDGAPPAAPVLRVGVADGVPGALSAPLLAATSADVRLVCRRGGVDELLADLALRRLDLVLTDRSGDPAAATVMVYHPLGSCGVEIWAHDRFSRVGGDFPSGMASTPLLVPTVAAQPRLRREVDAFLLRHGIQPTIAGEFSDSALMLRCAREGVGAVVISGVQHDELRSTPGMSHLGDLEVASVHYFAVTIKGQEVPTLARLRAAVSRLSAMRM
ncbi:MAG: LysR family transcriptional regulator [Myxococcota bacterium]